MTSPHFQNLILTSESFFSGEQFLRFQISFNCAELLPADPSSLISCSVIQVHWYHDEMPLPSASCPSLVLTHPTPHEIHYTHQQSSISWAGPLTRDQYIESEHQLASHLLAQPNGITHWVLIQPGPPGTPTQNERSVLASCETIPKRCLIKERDGAVRDGEVIGVAGVFCEPALRGRGYAGRMLRELALVLTRERDFVGSFLWSDIGPKFYADLGWKPFPSTHVELSASRSSPSSPSVFARPILADDIAALCAEDEDLLRTSMAGTLSSKTLLAIVPDRQTMSWHHKKEEYICEKLFGKQPDVEGVAVGETGDRVWAIWTRGFYGAVDDPKVGNKLYILRLVIENLNSRDSALHVEHLKAVLQAARREAAEWKLGHVEVWNLDPTLKNLIERTGIEHRIVEREIEGIPSLFWFGKGTAEDRIEWVASQKYAWC